MTICGGMGRRKMEDGRLKTEKRGIWSRLSLPHQIMAKAYFVHDSQDYLYIEACILCTATIDTNL